MFTNLKSIIKYVVLFHIGIMTTTSTAQEYTPTSPSVNALTKFDSHPVNLATGTPNISIPLTNLPTLSKDMSFDFVLNYHPSSVAVYDTLSGNTGRGWSLYNSGIVSYDGHFNFMGFNGTMKDINNLQVIDETTAVSENKGVRMRAVRGRDSTDVNNFHHAGHYDNDVSVTVYDEKGFKYVFDLADNYVKVQTGGNPDVNAWESRKIRNSAFHLTKVYDTKNGLLLTFNYDTFYKVEDYHEGNEKNTYRQLKEVIAHNVGKVVFEHTLGQMNNFDDFKYTSMILRDFNNNQINKFRFIYNGRNLTELIQDNSDNSKSLKHQFFYKAATLNMYNTISDVDNWGYNNEFDEWCLYDHVENTGTSIVYERSKFSKAVSPRHIMTGILEKIIYPTGGAVLYEYEANTFSFTSDIPNFEQRFNTTIDNWEHDPDYFYHLTPLNVHNYTKNTIASYTFTPGGANFFNFSVVDFPKKLYFKFDIDEFEQEMDLVDSPDATPTTMSGYPDFYLGGPNGLFEIFSHIEIVDFGTPTLPNLKSVRRFYKNNLNACSGQSLTLNTGTYQISLSSTAPHNGYASVQEITLVSNPKKWQYANGIRIKRIGYFENSSVPQNYYSSANPPTNYTPVKEMSYDYNLFEEPNRSSGYLLVGNVIEYADWAKKAVRRQEITPVWYKNVRVSQTGEAGRTDYTFISPNDFTNEVTNPPLSSTKYGKAKEIKIYNEAGVLQKKIENNYDYEEDYLWVPPLGEMVNSISLGWNALMQSKETSYFANSNPLEITANYTYVVDSRFIASKYVTNSVTGENLITKYYYDFRSTQTNLNRTALEKTEVFLNEKLLNTTFINYSNTWPIVNYGSYLGTPNVSYQAKTTLVSKHDNPLVQKMKVNLIDSNSNPVEIEQENGMKVSYIWGYNSTQVVAKIENMAFASIPANLITPIIDASNANNSVNLLTALNALRNHSSMANAMVTTFTHKPLIGVETVTDPKGFKMTFFYDKFNRLEKVTDHTGKLLSENEYHYRTQN